MTDSLHLFHSAIVFILSSYSRRTISPSSSTSSSIYITLSDGTLMPWLAWGNGTGKAKKHAIANGKLALESGIRHIDTAQLYQNEEQTGVAIQEAGVPKDQVYVTSKFSARGDEETPVPISEARASVQESLDRLAFVPDLYLIHNPFVVPPGELKALWKIFEDLKDEGNLKSIGVSNFRPQDHEAILDGAKYKPVVNQLEVHPYTLAHLEPVLALHKQHNIVATTYGALTPLLRHPTGGPLKPILGRISERLSKTYNESIDSMTVLMLWAKESGIGVVTASGDADRIKGLGKLYQNGADWELEKEEVDEITRVGKKIHFRHYTEHMEKEFPLPDLPQQ